ncbi:MAG TPA: hypothetical protein VFC63_19390 [Blastocatellia bacterium]|nr:hypothetical protein [Blastocatellia bacterium]
MQRVFLVLFFACVLALVILGMFYLKNNYASLLKIDNIWVNPQPNQPDGTRLYDIQLPTGGWWDTGIWVKPEQEIDVVESDNSSRQPFIMAVGNGKFQAGMDDRGYFGLGVVTTSEASYVRRTPGGYLVAAVGYQDKIWLRLSPDATAPYGRLQLRITNQHSLEGEIRLDESIIQRQLEKEDSQLHKITVIVLIITTVVSGFIYFIRQRKKYR